MKQLLGAAIAVLVISTSPAIAQTETDQVSQFEQRIAETKTRLNLSDEQIEDIKPILKTSFEAKAAVLNEYGIDLENGTGSGEKLGFRKARKLGKEMNAINENTVDELQNILTPEQLSEYKELQEERRSELRAKIKDSRQ